MKLTAQECEGITYTESMRAVVSIDLYAGINCDERGSHDWVGSAEGDMDGDSAIGETISLAAETFPPGTKLQILVPVCPRCGAPRWCCETVPDDVCAFPWHEWDEAQFS